MYYTKPYINWERYYKNLAKAKPQYLMDIIYEDGEVCQRWLTWDTICYYLNRKKQLHIHDIDFVEDNHYHENKAYATDHIQYVFDIVCEA